MTAPTFMDLALKAAENAGKAGEVPIGCVIVRNNEVIAEAGNRTLTDRDPTAHAEILAIRQATAAVGSERLTDCDLYVTLEPCTMCAGAISFARIRRLYYGAADTSMLWLSEPTVRASLRSDTSSALTCTFSWFSV